jgi:hypothetical protein
LLITIVGLGLVVGRGRGMVGWGMVDYWGVGRGMVNNWSIGRGMDCMVDNRGSMYCVMNSRGSMVDGMATESGEGNTWASSYKGDKSNQSKDLHDAAM